MCSTLKRQKTFNNYGTSLICESVISNFFDQFIEGIQLNLNSNVMDIGCGFGRAAAYLAKKGVKKIYAIDLSYNNIEKVKNDYPELIKNKTIIPLVEDFSKLNLKKAPFYEDKFSLILLINVLHFWDEAILKGNLNKILTSLDDNGYLLMLVQTNTVDELSCPPRFNTPPSLLQALLLESGFKTVFIQNDNLDAGKYMGIACKKNVNLEQIMSWYS